MKPVVVRNVAIGEAIPKICVPIVGKTIDEILNQAKHICEIGADVVEWRVAFVGTMIAIAAFALEAWLAPRGHSAEFIRTVLLDRKSGVSGKSVS